MTIYLYFVKITHMKNTLNKQHINTSNNTKLLKQQSSPTVNSGKHKALLDVTDSGRFVQTP